MSLLLSDFLTDGGDEDRGDDGEEGEEGERSYGGAPSFTRKTALIVFLVDGSQPMLDAQTFGEGELDVDAHKCEVKNYYTLAISTIAHLCRDKVKKGHNDHVGVVLYNVAPGDDDTRDYKGVRQLLPLGGLTCQSIMALRKEAAGGTYQKEIAGSDWVGVKPAPQPYTGEKMHLEDALCFAQNTFHASDVKDGLKQICILTCADDPVGGAAGSASRRARRRALMKRCQDIKGLKVGIDAYPLVPLDKVTLAGIEGDAPPPKGVFRAGVVFRDVLTLMETRKRKVEDEILEGVLAGGGAEEEVATAIGLRLTKRDISFMVKDLEGRVVTRSMGSLKWSITDDLGVAVRIFKLAMPHPTPKSISVYSKDNSKIKMVTERFDEQGNMLNSNRRDQIGKIFTYGQEKVHMQEADIADYKNVSVSKGISLLGFVPASSICPEFNLESPYFMYPHEAALPGSTKAFSALWSEMHETGMAAICVAKIRAVGQPRRYACVVSRLASFDVSELITPDGFHLIPLPFNEDVRMPPPSQHIAAPDDAVVKAAEGLVMTIRMEPDNCAPESFRSPAIARHVSMLEALSMKTTQDEKELQEIEADLLMNFEDEEEVRDVLPPLIRAFKDAVDPDYDTNIGVGVGTKRAREPRAEKKTAADLKDADGNWKIESEADLQCLTIPILKEYLKEHNLKLAGAKPELIKRICEHYFKT